ncbi:MAG: hypothetical protein H0V66_13520 [Bdellovibrionales bacterium]|nr:hypothetical protein [Bdellovibrionales bacterium]
MKLLILLAVAFSFSAQAKTCTASLHGKLRYQEFNYPLTKVFYPESTTKSYPAQWLGNVVTKNFLPPYPVDIECGQPYLKTKFDKFEATGMLPQRIETFPWSEMRSTGPVMIPAQSMYGWGDSYEYPAPITFFRGVNDINVYEMAPAGVKDICDVTKIPLSSVKEIAYIQPDPFMTSYNYPYTADTSYVWDTTSTPTNEIVQLELEEPYVSISCDAQWKYEASYELIYSVSPESARVCGPGTVTRTLKLEGDFYVAEDNNVFGYVTVDLPKVSSTGCVKGSFFGSKFVIPMEGKLVTDAAGKKTVLLPPLEGGDAIGWTFTLMCEPMGGDITNTVYGTIGYFLGQINEQEKPSSEDSGYLMLDGDGMDNTTTIDWGGLGIYTIKRSFKKI